MAAALEDRPPRPSPGRSRQVVLQQSGVYGCHGAEVASARRGSSLAVSDADRPPGSPPKTEERLMRIDLREEAPWQPCWRRTEEDSPGQYCGAGPRSLAHLLREYLVERWRKP